MHYALKELLVKFPILELESIHTYILSVPIYFFNKKKEN